jgi:polysaccharide biosynthesis protein PslG
LPPLSLEATPPAHASDRACSVQGTVAPNTKGVATGTGDAACIMSDDNELSSTATAVASVTPVAPAIPASFFGMTVLNFIQVSPAVPFGTTRTWDAYPGMDWSDENPARGIYHFATLDQFLAKSAESGTDVVYTLGRTPRWASSKPNAPGPYGPGQCAPPARMEDWDNFLMALATHAAGKIHYWELWNEPDGSKAFYCGDISAMVTMARHASAILKAVDPTAVLLSPGVTGPPGPAWLRSFLQAGGGDAVDAIAFHGYWSTTAEDINYVVSKYKKVLADNRVSGKLLWDTEASWSDFGKAPLQNPLLRAAFDAKYYMLQWSDGVSRVIWYAYDGGEIWGGMWDRRNGLHIDGVAYREVYHWMVGATPIGSCNADPHHTWTCDYARQNGYRSRAVWNSRGNVSYTVPSIFTRYRNLSGTVTPLTTRAVQVGNQPILLESAPWQ